MPALKRPVPSSIWIGLALFLVSFGVYCATLARTVGFIDSGELAWASATLGIPHPTGYPLYTLLTYLFVAALPFFEPIVAINIFSAVAVSAATAGFFLF
ncbi:MAG: protein O-mannosyl-transferase family [Limisphaerales bacterium]